MPIYKISINTQAYRPMRCSKQNWEPGTINNFMEALGKYKVTERSLAGVKRRIDIFDGCWHNLYEVNGTEGFSWYDNPKNKCHITFYDELCGFNRTHDVAPYGFKQGYFNHQKVIDELLKNGVAKIPFAWVYDIRQYNKRYDGCYMKIERA